MSRDDEAASNHSTSPALWEAASLPSGLAVRIAARCTAAVVVLAALVAFVGGWRWTLGTAIGGMVVTAVLWGSAKLLMAGVRKVTPAVGLMIAMTIYLVAVIGLFVVAATTRGSAGRVGVVPLATAVGALVAVAAWTVSLVVVHVRHDRPGRRRRRPR